MKVLLRKKKIKINVVQYFKNIIYILFFFIIINKFKIDFFMEIF